MSDLITAKLPTLNATGELRDVLVATRTTIIPDMSRDAYFAEVGLNPSSLAAGIQRDRFTPLFVKDAYEDNVDSTQDHLVNGTLCHMLCFEPQRVPTDVAIWKGGRRAGNLWNAFTFQNAGKLIVKEDSYKEAVESLLPLVTLPEFCEYTAAGQAEVAVFAAICGMQCRGQLDWISTSEPSLWDLKTARDIEPEAFGKQFFSLHYDVKMAMYRQMLRINKLPVDDVFIAAIRNKKPWDAILYPIPDAVLDLGWEKAEEAIETMKECITKDVYPGAGGGEAFGDLFVPDYVMQQRETDWSA
jgi:hypothetical protein